MGATHARLRRSNQDAWSFASTPSGVAAVVADGCGSGQFSEVGARIGAGVLSQALVAEIARTPSSDHRTRFANAVEALVGTLRSLISALGGSPREMVRQHFLFTLVGVLADAHEVAVFAVGDGVVVIDGRVVRLGPFPDNAPPYLAYRLFDDAPIPEVTWPVISAADEIQTLLLGTDGLSAFSDEALSALATDARLFDNQDALRRRLALAARSRRSAPALLHDDATAVLLRARPGLGPCPGGAA